MKTHPLSIPLLGAALAIATAGCGHAAISPQLRSARETMALARASTAARLEPDELLIAEGTLDRAESEEDGSEMEADLAYVAQREMLMAMSDARRGEIEGAIASEQTQYRNRLVALAHRRGEELEQTEQRLLEEQRRLAEQGQALAEEAQARRQAEATAADALRRLHDLALVRTEREDTIITISGEVLFETDRAELRPEARVRLLPVADAIRSMPEQTIVIEGHTDSRGSNDYNDRLSQRRADAVREYLVAEGVPAERIQAIGRGEIRPIADNESPEGRADNRRVEVILRPASARTLVPLPDTSATSAPAP